MGEAQDIQVNDDLTVIGTEDSAAESTEDSAGTDAAENVTDGE